MSLSNERGRNRIGWRWWLSVGLVLIGTLIWIPQPVFASLGAIALAHRRALLTGFVVIGVTLVVGSSTLPWRRHAQRADSDDDKSKPLLREIPAWSIWVGIVVLVLIGLITTWWLVWAFGSATAQDRIKLEAIKLAGSIVVGTGGVAALVLTARRQRVSELDLLQRDRVADDNRHDANERRATELYTAAADQLASDKAPVRMAGMYALARLGETNKQHRQTVVNLLCAYLRTLDTTINNGKPASEAAGRNDEQQPLLLDLAPALATAAGISLDGTEQQQQEREVRLTAQRLLSQHLQPRRNEDGTPTNTDYWADMDLDLSGASLYDWNFTGCEVQSAQFRKAHFRGDTRFDNTHIKDDASFNEAQFDGLSRFYEAHFESGATFDGAHFGNRAIFSKMHFSGDGWFDKAHFHAAVFDEVHFWGGAHFNATQFDHATFSTAHFHGGVTFNLARFYQGAMFVRAQFYRDSWFHKAQFGGVANMEDAHFEESAFFSETQFGGKAVFVRSRFDRVALFGTASFDSEAVFHGAQTRIDQDDEYKSEWPVGWVVVEVDPGDDREGRWGTLIPDNYKDKFAARNTDSERDEH